MVMPTGTLAFRGSGLLHGLAGSYPPEVAQGFEDAFDLGGALGAFAAELGGEGFGGGGGVGSEKLPEQCDLLGESGGPNWELGVRVHFLSFFDTSGPAVPRIVASSHKDAGNPKDHDADDKLSWG